MKKPRILISSTYGFCSGVKNSIKILNDSIDNKQYNKYYLLGNIVHNEKVTKSFTDKGCLFLNHNEFDKSLELNSDESLVISAHGISDILKDKLVNCSINYIDTTCPIVRAGYNKITDYLNKGYEVIYFGKKGHAETEAIIHNSCHIHLIESINDIDKLNIKSDLICFGCQTTISYIDNKEIFDELKSIYPNITNLETMCNITKNRQLELIKLLENTDKKVMVVVVGDPLSNNTDMLYKIAQRYGADSVKVNSLSSLKIEYFNYDLIYVTSGTSTIDSDVFNIKEYIENIVDFISNHDNVE